MNNFSKSLKMFSSLNNSIWNVNSIDKKKKQCYFKTKFINYDRFLDNELTMFIDFVKIIFIHIIIFRCDRI